MNSVDVAIQDIQTNQRMCRACNQPITDRYVLKALDSFWHEGCLKCACCECRLGDIGSSLYCKSNLILCKRDYLRLFGIPGKCSQCSKPIAAFELVMRARENAYHIECFGCQMCRKRLVVGEAFCFHDNKVLCLDRCAKKAQDAIVKVNDKLTLKTIKSSAKALKTN
ncbi:LIM domain only protein 3-like [Actinia tenebrosa]|uniref:LIM domain only protein 3-like n=1 Tax=Actinia tenebrosa TaxID=6105 RepID=A0A6P8HLM5_ACTTE|nr:LIM domain only protein 3-like [Actinia tenebrosa]